MARKSIKDIDRLVELINGAGGDVGYDIQGDCGIRVGNRDTSRYYAPRGTKYEAWLVLRGMEQGMEQGTRYGVEKGINRDRDRQRRI